MNEQEFCERCGKAIKGDPQIVGMTTDGRYFTAANFPADIAGTSRDQGGFPVGPECFRKIKAAGTAGYSWRDMPRVAR